MIEKTTTPLNYIIVQVVKVAPPSVNEVVDTTGAGDAFLGGLIVGKITNYILQDY